MKTYLINFPDGATLTIQSASPVGYAVAVKRAGAGWSYFGKSATIPAVENLRERALKRAGVESAEVVVLERVA